MAERIPREQALRRVHGTGALFAAAYGNVGSSIYYALGLVALYALGLTPVTFIIAGIIFACTAASYTEATVMYPEAGGSSSFARHAFNELSSFLAGWAQMLTYIITISISAFFVPHYLAVFWEPLGEGPWDVIFGVALVALLAALNVKGTEESAKLNLVLAIADLLTQIVLVGIGLYLVFDPDLLVSQVQLGVAPTWSDFLLGIAVGMVAYTGIETISNMAEEAKDAARTIPRGVGATVAAVLGLYALLPAVALSAMPVTQDASGEYTTELGTEFADDPVLGIVENLGLASGLTSGLEIYVGILAAVILLIATNAGLIGISRLTFSMGQYRQLPDVLRRVHPKFGTPHVAILVFSGIAALSMLPGEATFLATVYSFGATLSFTVAHVSVIRLRARYPDFARSWKPPGNVRIFGISVPLTAIFGGIGTAGAFIVAIAIQPVIAVVGIGWMLFGLTIYVFYRRNQGLPLTGTVKVASLDPLGVEEIEYRSILLIFEDGPFPKELVVMTRSLAAKRRRAIHVLSLIEVPVHLPIDTPMRAAEQRAQAKVSQAKLLCGQRITGSIVRVRPGQAGKTIVETAREIGAGAIVIQLRYRNGKPLFGRTLETVFAKRPCRVIVSATPEEHKPVTVPVG